MYTYVYLSATYRANRPQVSFTEYCVSRRDDARINGPNVCSCYTFRGPMKGGTDRYAILRPSGMICGRFVGQTNSRVVRRTFVVSRHATQRPSDSGGGPQPPGKWGETTATCGLLLFLERDTMVVWWFGILRRLRDGFSEVRRILGVGKLMRCNRGWKVNKLQNQINSYKCYAVAEP